LSSVIKIPRAIRREKNKIKHKHKSKAECALVIHMLPLKLIALKRWIVDGEIEMQFHTVIIIGIISFHLLLLILYTFAIQDCRSYQYHFDSTIIFGSVLLIRRKPHAFFLNLRTGCFPINSLRSLVYHRYNNCPIYVYKTSLYSYPI